MDSVKAFLHSKTLAFNSVLAAVSVGAIALPDVTPIFGPKGAAWIGLAVAIINIVLRFLTTQPVLEKVSAKETGTGA